VRACSPYGQAWKRVSESVCPRRERGSAFVADEERAAERVFQRVYSRTDRRLRHMKPVRGVTKLPAVTTARNVRASSVSKGLTLFF